MVICDTLKIKSFPTVKTSCSGFPLPYTTKVNVVELVMSFGTGPHEIGFDLTFTTVTSMLT